MSTTSLIKFLVLAASVALAIGSPSQLSCDFDHGFDNCRYLTTLPQTGWTVLPRSNGQGNYLLLNKTRTQMTSYITGMKDDVCVRFDYLVFGPQAQLKVDVNYFRPVRGYDQEQAERFLFTRNQFSSRIDQWQSFHKTMHLGNRTRQYRIAISASMDGGPNTADVAFDNLEFSQGACGDDEAVPDVLECDFDGESITGIPNITELCPWIRTSTNLGVQYGQDHSTQAQGGILVPYVNQAVVAGEQYWATIQTPIAENSGAHCFSFWTSARETGYLYEAYLLDSPDADVDTSMRLEPVFSEEDMSGKETWNRHMVSVKSHRHEEKFLTLRVRATIKWLNQVLIDSLRLDNQACAKPATCDFGTEGFCGYSNVAFDRRTMQRNTWYQKSTAVDDSQLPNGKYVFAQFDKLEENYHSIESLLESDLIRTKGNHCVTFEYQVNDDVQGLEVVTLEFRSDVPTTSRIVQIIDNVTDVASGEWHTHSQTFRANSKSMAFRVGFKVNATRQSFVALRSVAVTHGSCRGDNGTFDEQDFHCSQTGHYKPLHLICDGVEDCPMGEDEDEELCGKMRS